MHHSRIAAAPDLKDAMRTGRPLTFADTVTAERNRNHARHMAERAAMPATRDFDTIGAAYDHGDAVAAGLTGITFNVEQWHKVFRCTFFRKAAA